jgi:hypothetical protein
MARAIRGRPATASFKTEWRSIYYLSGHTALRCSAQPIFAHNKGPAARAAPCFKLLYNCIGSETVLVVVRVAVCGPGWSVAVAVDVCGVWLLGWLLRGVAECPFF